MRTVEQVALLIRPPVIETSEKRGETRKDGDGGRYLSEKLCKGWLLPWSKKERLSRKDVKLSGDVTMKLILSPGRSKGYRMTTNDS